MSQTSTRLLARCSFCLRPNTEVGKLVSGPGVYICDSCVALCADIIGHATDGLPRATPWESETDVDQVLAVLPQVAAAGAQVDENLARWVSRARVLGATWARIGEALHMTRQSAWERFSTEG